MPEPRKDRLLADAGALRQWGCVRLFSDCSTPPPVVSATAWRLFLAVEGCASLLRARAIGRALVQEADAVAEKELARASRGEAQRALAARRELRTLSEIAAEYDWRLVVLKAAVVLSEGGVLQFNDVDVLADRATAHALSDLLGERGYQATSAAIPGRTAPGRIRPDGIAIDVQYGLKGLPDIALLLERAVQLPGTSLRVLHPDDHAWHILLHITVQHPWRRGRLRDLWLLQQALGRADIGLIRERARALRQPVIDAVLEQSFDGRDPAPWMQQVHALRASGRPWRSRALDTRIDLHALDALLPEQNSPVRRQLQLWREHRSAGLARGSLVWLPARLVLGLLVSLRVRRARRLAHDSVARPA